MSQSGWAAHIAAMDLGDYIVWVIFSVAAGAIGLFYFFRNTFRARLIEDMPTSMIRSAAQGYVELIGQAQLVKGEPIRSPLTGTRCCWWRYKIERKGHKDNWHTVETRTSDSPFLIEDNTGLCMVDPEGAHVIPWERNIWYGNSKYPVQAGGGGGGGINFTVAGVKIGMGEYRYTEEFVFEHNPLYAIGHFRSFDELDHRESRSEIARNLLRDWKQDKAGLLARFDKNRDGKINMEEWETARKTAVQLAGQEHQEILQNQIPHLLSKPSNKRQPFILATRDEEDLTKNLRLWSYIGLAFGLIGSGLALFFIVSRLGA